MRGKREKCNHIGLSPANCTSSNSNEIHKVSALPQKILMNRERNKKVCRIQKLIACTFSPKKYKVKIFLRTIKVRNSNNTLVNFNPSYFTADKFFIFPAR